MATGIGKGEILTTSKKFKRHHQIARTRK